MTSCSVKDSASLPTSGGPCATRQIRFATGGTAGRLRSVSLLDAVYAAGVYPPLTAPSSAKKRYSELLSAALAMEIAGGLRARGFGAVKPDASGGKEKEFQGGLAPKRVDVSFADERNGLMLAVSVKTISYPKFSKNLKNRFGDMCSEAISLHMRFPYAVISGLFAFPVAANHDVKPISTFQRATRLFGTISGRADYGAPGERFESFVMMLYQPVMSASILAAGPAGAGTTMHTTAVVDEAAAEEAATAAAAGIANPDEAEEAAAAAVAAATAGATPWIRLVDTRDGRSISESEYFEMLADSFSDRNPHMVL